MQKFYVTTPIYYVNDVPHIGHAYTTIMADVIARWYRLKGLHVFFLTGTDENSFKTLQGAKKFGFDDVKEYADHMAKQWKKTWKELGISYDDFIRTTEPRHKKKVREFFNKIMENGDIYKGKYTGLYCDGCETFLTESELVKGLCPLHKTPPRQVSEENYFFRLSKYSDKLLKHIKENPDFILPKTRRNEVVSFIKSGLKDISISRPGSGWGIKLPNDETHVFWVWFDALINYISAGEKFWPADVHLMAKDIIRFHAVIWPAMLMSAGYELPRRIFAHGFFTINGQKISKSLGNAIDPVILAKKYSIDALRYFFVREIPFGEDGDFSEESLKRRLNNELANDLGNLLYRTLTLAERFKGKIEGDNELEGCLRFKKIDKYMDQLKFHKAMDEIWFFVKACNKYINEKEPWKLKGDELSNVLYNLLESLRIISILIDPFMPETSKKMREQLGIRSQDLSMIRFGEFKGKPRRGEILFRKVE